VSAAGGCLITERDPLNNRFRIKKKVCGRLNFCSDDARVNIEDTEIKDAPHLLFDSPLRTTVNHHACR
jgi:hypothetical protein